MLQKQEILIPFASGMDTKTDPKHADPQNPVVIKNAVFDKLGRVSKRSGFRNLAITPPNPTQWGPRHSGLFARGKDVCALVSRRNTGNLRPDDDGSGLVGSLYYDLITEGVLTKCGFSEPHSQKRIGCASNIYNLVAYDSTVVGTFLFVAWMEGNASVCKAYYSVYDRYTGSVVVPKTNVSGWPTVGGLATDRGIRCVVTGTYVWIWAMLTGTCIAGTRWNSSAPTALAAQMADVSAGIPTASTYAFDACEITDSVYGASSLVAYSCTITGTTTLRLVSIDSAGTVRHTVDIAEAPLGVIGLNRIKRGTASTYYVALAWHVATPRIRSAVYDQNLTSVWAPADLFTPGANETLVACTLGESLTNDVKIRYWLGLKDVAATPDTLRTVVRKQNYNTGAITTGSRYLYNAVPVSRAFQYDTRNNVMILFTATGQQKIAMVSTSSIDDSGYNPKGYRVSASCMHDDGCFPSMTCLSQVFTDITEPEVFRVAYPARNDVLRSDLYVNRFEFGLMAPDRVQLDGAAYVADGNLRLFDGRFAELGYFHFPVITRLDGYHTGGALSDGTYFYRAIYEWSDRLGDIHRSASSIPASITLSSGGAVQSITGHVITDSIADPFRIETGAEDLDGGGVAQVRGNPCRS